MRLTTAAKVLWHSTPLQIFRAIKNGITKAWFWSVVFYLYMAFWLTVMIGSEVADPKRSMIERVFAYCLGVLALTWMMVPRSRKRKAKPTTKPSSKIAGPKVTLDLDKPNPDATPRITARQALLVEKVRNPESHEQYTALLDLWADIYGKPADFSRPLMEIHQEVAIALNEMTS